ncbi:MAG TPA: phenylacetate--CoA ligase family protein [Burkholderiales bacterium]|jgi:phenylacetate-CoA ligase|nr:phenylacetate--CoA ligase family protein [Burkholderiales bacterium]
MRSADEAYRAQVATLFERSGFYREKLGAAGFAGAAAVGGLERIADLPFTEKDELRKSQAEQPPLGAHAAIAISQAARIYSTSGTSGAPLYIPLTRSDVEQWREIGRRTYSRNGLRAGERVVTTYGAGPFVAGASLAAFEAIGCAHIPVGVGNTDRLLTAIEKLQPEALACTPSYALHLIERAQARSQEINCIRRIIVGGEPGGGEEGLRGRLEAMWGAKIYEIMGIGDVAASLWGECERQAGMHFSAEGLVHVELVDPDSGVPRQMTDGQTGELVYTHLAREAAPLLRFRSRDHVRVWTSTCACGSRALRVRCIGRTDDMLIVRGVNVFPSAVREVVARFQPQVTGAMLIRPRAKGVRQEPPLPVLVEGNASLQEAIAGEIRSRLLFTAEVRMVPPLALPRSDYKVKLVDYSEARS